ncbi:MAG: hypothetical protein ACI9J4_001350 [Paraglaciecola sp.]|jgi:hypothetical protein|tara:strand:- start:420 stop:740 length:321 start_codon:yes stop_codon:yes gene_type:complete
MSEVEKTYSQIKSIIVESIDQPWAEIIIDAELDNDDDDDDWMVVVSWINQTTQAKRQLAEDDRLNELVPYFIKCCDEGNIGNIYSAKISEHFENGVTITVNRQQID